ncbi:DUF6301 family protein [Nocardia asteroides]|uniref:DUF6301 family protein n=1 Tax=Nocardia asteroides TaxID=1824 RepID=UPI0033C7E0E3
MRTFRSIPIDQAADLADKLSTLDWSWTLADAPAIAEQFGWTVITQRARWIMLDTGYGPGSGTFRAKNSQVTEIELQLTDFDTPDQNAQFSATFDSITAAITEKLGTPTMDDAVPPPQYRWAGPKATIVLKHSAASVWLYLITNARLADDDRNIELDELGLL